MSACSIGAGTPSIFGTDNDFPDPLKVGELSAAKRSLKRKSLRFSDCEYPTKRWDGLSRTAQTWDALKRDCELWFDDGDCYVHLCGQGQSRRGPSFRISISRLHPAKCKPLLSMYLENNQLPLSQATSTNTKQPRTYHLYIPAPIELDTKQAYRYHVTTRNYFALALCVPLVGFRLGEALISVMERIELWQTDERLAERDLLNYLKEMGYADFCACPDHALAALQLAEKFKFQDLWIDAFTHCVGQEEYLSESSEYQFISSVTKATISRAATEMRQRIASTDTSITDFLEEPLSGSHLGLRDCDRAHLDHFRTFLHTFYVSKYGYWPRPLDVCIRRSLYFDFRDLYEYLVDTESSTSFYDNKLACGGLCVLQNIQALDNRSDFSPLPHPLPLIPLSVEQEGPALTPLKRISSCRSRQAKLQRRLSVLKSLNTATNRAQVHVLQNGLVRDFSRYEKEWIMGDEEKALSNAIDARKVRWILIYAMLQTLISVTRAPGDVHFAEDVPYPLCCKVPDMPPWNVGVPLLLTRVGSQNPGSSNFSTSISPSQLRIEPDVDYISTYGTSNLSRGSSGRSSRSRSIAPSLKRTLSRASSKVVRSSSLTINTNFRRASLPARAKTVDNRVAPSSEIIVPQYGNGLNPTNLLQATHRPYSEILIEGYGNGMNRNPTIVKRPNFREISVERYGNGLISNYDLATRETASIPSPHNVVPHISQLSTRHRYRVPDETASPEAVHHLRPILSREETVASPTSTSSPVSTTPSLASSSGSTPSYPQDAEIRTPDCDSSWLDLDPPAIDWGVDTLGLGNSAHVVDQMHSPKASRTLPRSRGSGNEQIDDAGVMLLSQTLQRRSNISERNKPPVLSLEIPRSRADEIEAGIARGCAYPESSSPQWRESTDNEESKDQERPRGIFNMLLIRHRSSHIPKSHDFHSNTKVGRRRLVKNKTANLRFNESVQIPTLEEENGDAAEPPVIRDTRRVRGNCITT